MPGGQSYGLVIVGEVGVPGVETSTRIYVTNTLPDVATS